jgi:hypothetical protein
MSILIEEVKKTNDLLNGGNSRISSNLKEIIIFLSKNKKGVFLELPWNTEVNGKYSDSLIVLAYKVTKENLYYVNPDEKAASPHAITEEDKKGPPRQIYRNGIETIKMEDLVRLKKIRPIYGLISG